MADASSPLADHQPFATAPEIQSFYRRSGDLYFSGDCAIVLSLDQQVLDLAQAAMASRRTPQTALDVVVAMHKLGRGKINLDDLPGAQAMLEQAVALGEHTVGPTHPRIAQCLAELGKILTIRGRYDEADATLQRALTMQEELLGPEHTCPRRSLGWAIRASTRATYGVPRDC